MPSGLLNATSQKRIVKNSIFPSHLGRTRTHWKFECTTMPIGHDSRGWRDLAALDTVEPTGIHTTVIDATPSGLEVLSYRSENRFQSRVDGELTPPVGAAI
jgi:hypothetical protein